MKKAVLFAAVWDSVPRRERKRALTSRRVARFVFRCRRVSEGTPLKCKIVNFITPGYAKREENTREERRWEKEKKWIRATSVPRRPAWIAGGVYRQRPLSAHTFIFHSFFFTPTQSHVGYIRREKKNGIPGMKDINMYVRKCTCIHMYLHTARYGDVSLSWFFGCAISALSGGSVGAGFASARVYTEAVTAY